MSYPMDFDDWGRSIHEWARGKGFYDRERITLPNDSTEPRYAPARTVPNPSLPSEKLMLIVTEVAEVQEALRDGDTEAEAEEVADILIRVLDYATWRGINLDREVSKKMGKNRDRPHLHGRAAF